MQRDKSAYSRIVDLKKRYIKTRLVPTFLSPILDGFFNALHNALIQTKDISRDTLIKSRDMTRDAIVRSRDITRDALIRSRDITKDSIIKSKDITRDALIKSKDMTKDSLVRSRDVTRDALEETRDRVRDSLIQSTDTAVDSIIISRKMAEESSQSALYATRVGSIFLFPFVLSKNIFLSLYSSLQLMSYVVTESSDQEAVSSIDKIIVNSLNVKSRVENFYSRDSIVINPPIDTTRLRYRSDDGYWLSVNRITPEKRIEIQLDAFASLPKQRLLIVGGSDDNHRNYTDSLIERSTYNVQFLGSVNDNVLVDLYSRCRGFITTSLDEDFGMTAVEAMASGKPVIAPNEGGYKESVIHKVTGYLVDNIDKDKLVHAIETVTANLNDNPKLYRSSATERAQQFSTETFVQKIRNIIGE